MMIMMAMTIKILKIMAIAIVIIIKICTQQSSGEVVLVTLWKRQGKQSPLWLSHKTQSVWQKNMGGR